MTSFLVNVVVFPNQVESPYVKLIKQNNHVPNKLWKEFYTSRNIQFDKKKPFTNNKSILTNLQTKYHFFSMTPHKQPRHIIKLNPK